MSCFAARIGMVTGLALALNVATFAVEPSEEVAPPQIKKTASPDDAQLTMDFETCPDVNLRGEIKNPEVVGPIRYMDGVDGQAVVVGVSDGKKRENMVFRLPIEKDKPIIDRAEGTISFWACPLDWDGDDEEFHVLFEAKGENARLLIYKYFDSHDLLFLLGPSEKDANGSWQWTVIRTSIEDWKRGEWRLITCTWKERSGMRLFMDGRLQGSEKIKTRPETPFTAMAVGGISPIGWQRGQGQTAIDQLQIWNRKLTTTQIKKIYKSRDADAGARVDCAVPSPEFRRSRR